MDIGGVTKTSAVGTVQAVPRADVQAIAAGTAVDLPLEKTVQAAPAGSAVRLDLRDRPAASAVPPPATAVLTAERGVLALRETIQKHLDIDPRTRSVVVSETDPDTGRTVFQLPDEATLRLRAFARELREKNLPAPDEGYRRVERIA